MRKKWIWLSALAALAVIAAILAVYLPVRGGRLRVIGGAISGARTDWLIVNAGSPGKPEYYKLGVVGGSVNYARDAIVERGLKSDSRETAFAYFPKDNAQFADYYYMYGVMGEPDALTDIYYTGATADAQNLLSSDTFIDSVNGARASGYVISRKEGETYTRYATAFMQSRKGASVLIKAFVSADAPDELPSDAAVIQFALEALGKITLEP